MSKRYSSIVVLTGAGISAESGVPTFRASDGLWEGHKVEDVATPAAFIRDPDQVHRFYNQRRRFLLDGIEPNAAHQAIADFSQQFSGQFTLVTQNIDNLHQRAGTKYVYPMHGELLKIRCQDTGQLFDCTSDTQKEQHCPCCDIAGNLRPHVVWFGEMPLFMETIEQALAQCDLFIAIGTSGNVYPAAGFVQTARYYGADTVEMNLVPTTPDHLGGSVFDQEIIGPATVTVPTFFQLLLGSSVHNDKNT